MTATLAHTNSSRFRLVGFTSVIVVLATVQLVVGTLATESWLLSFLPLLAVIAVVSFLNLEVGLAFLAIGVYLRIELPWFVGVYPADLLVFVILGGLVLRAMTSGRSSSFSTPYDATIIAMLAVFALSLLGAHDTSIGVKNWLRHAQMFGVVVAAATVLNGNGVSRILRLLLATSLLLCVPTVISAIQVGGSKRVFGVAAMFFPFFLSVGVIHCSVGYLLSQHAWKRWAWAALAMTFAVGIVVSQTREAMLFLMIGMLFVSILVWVWADRRSLPVIRRRVAWLVITVVVVVLIILSGSIALFQTSASRVYQAVEGHSNTIQIRLFLWRMGIQTFVESPGLGIGLGQIQKWDELLPFWHLDPMAQFSRGLGAHNDVISYAAETGLAGLSAIFAFFWCVIRCGWKEWRQAETPERLFRLLVVWVPCLALIARFFFGTHTFYSLGGLFNCLYFGMLVGHTRWAADERVQRVQLGTAW